MSLTEAERARQLARFRSMRGRAAVLSFPQLGPEVQASTPQELQQETEQALVEAALETDAS
jgi:hypothetical protein